MVESAAPRWMNSNWIRNETRDLFRLGGGSFGSVFSFTDPRSKTQKALKVVEYETAKAAEKLSSNKDLSFETWLEQSIKEVENLKLLGKCEYILNLEYYLIDYDFQCIYLVTELAKCSLTSRLEEIKNKITVEEIKRIFYSILKALKHAHGMNVTHRDIKPDNVLIGISGNPLLCDWGISRRMKTYGSQRHSTSPMGTALYLPPEIYDVADAKEEGKNISIDLFKCDIYSTGLLILVCFGLPEVKLKYIEKEEEVKHNLKINEYLKTFVKPKSTDVMVDLIKGMTHFDRKKRFDLNKTLEFCGNNKILAQLVSESEKQVGEIQIKI